MTQEKAPEPIILIPAYQPGQALVESTNQLLAAGFTIVVVDDGSEETYDSIFNALNDTVHVLSHEVNKGKGAALKTGYRYIQRVFKNYTIVTADSDGQHDIQDIKKNGTDLSPSPAHITAGFTDIRKHQRAAQKQTGKCVNEKNFLAHH